MLAPDDPGRIVAVFDWDMCTLGDPLSDVGALLAWWCLPDDPPHFRTMAMMPLDDRFLRREAAHRPLRPTQRPRPVRPFTSTMRSACSG